MVKKLLLVAVIGAAAFAAIKGTRAGSYAREEVSAIGDWVDSKVPVEKKITALRKEINTLDKEIDKTSDELAKEIVEVDHLTRDISTEKVALAHEEKKVRAVGETISGATEKAVAYGSFMVNVDEAKQLLSDDVKRVVIRKQTLEAMQETLVSRERIKDALLKQVEGIKRQKRELAVAVDRLEADFKRLQLQQIESKYQFDDTKLAAVKQSLKDLQKDIDIKRAKLKLAPTVASDGAPATGLNVEDILAPLNPVSAKKTN
ncbi:hypothetical protein BH11PLA2_BH11PLA2_06450 [soil metagenome]